MTVRFEAAVPQFAVADVVRTAEYYRDVLGFETAGYWNGERAGLETDPPRLEDRIYGQRELVVRDCNGLVLAFGESKSA